MRHPDVEVIHSGLERYFDALRAELAANSAIALPEVRGEQSYCLRGCYASVARFKYQISLNAFLNWLVKVDRLQVNPLAKVDRIDTRGKQVRSYRAFTTVELVRLFRCVNTERRLAYRTLLYTGQRMGEIAALRWADVHLEEAQPFVLIREETTKDKDKRAVPVHPMLATELRASGRRE